MLAGTFIKGSHISLRPLQIEDAAGPYFEWLNSELICQGNSHYKFPKTREALVDYIRSANQYQKDLTLAIILNETSEHIGNVTLQNINWINQSAEFAILIGQLNVWGKGVGKEAAGLLIKHGFNHLNLRRIYLGTYDENIGMQKIAESLGFVEEGRRRQADYKNGRFVDIIEYGLLREEFSK